MSCRGFYPLAAALLRAHDNEIEAPSPPGMIGKSELSAQYVDDLDRARRPPWPGRAYLPDEDQGIPSIFWGHRTHTGLWIP